MRSNPCVSNVPTGKAHRLLACLLSVVMAVTLSPVAFAGQAFAANEVVASGTWGTCPWEMTADGTITVHPGVGESQEGELRSPWYNCEPKRIVFASEGGNRVVAPEDSGSLLPIALR